MKDYLKPEMDVVVFESADVLMTSGDTIVEEPIVGNNYNNVYDTLS